MSTQSSGLKRRVAKSIQLAESPAVSVRPAACSDDALALKFSQRYGDDLRYTDAWGRWSVWNGNYWERDDTRQVLDIARQICREASSNCGDEKLARHIAGVATVAAVERLARADRRHAATVDQWDADPWLLNTPCGVVDLRTGALRPDTREAYCTKMTAVAPDRECLLWKAFLSRITDRNNELQEFLQRICGYALTGITREHAFFFLYGTGANGKSVFINTISGAMGDYARTARLIQDNVDSGGHCRVKLSGVVSGRPVAVRHRGRECCTVDAAALSQ